MSVEKFIKHRTSGKNLPNLADLVRVRAMQAADAALVLFLDCDVIWLRKIDDLETFQAALHGHWFASMSNPRSLRGYTSAEFVVQWNLKFCSTIVQNVTRH